MIIMLFKYRQKFYNNKILFNSLGQVYYKKYFVPFFTFKFFTYIYTKI